MSTSADASAVSRPVSGCAGSAESASAIHWTDAPPACIVAVGTNDPGTTLSNVKVRIAGSCSGASAANEIHDEVPRHT